LHFGDGNRGLNRQWPWGFSRVLKSLRGSNMSPA
jgi:hypothetical protein